MTTAPSHPDRGLDLAPMRAARFASDGAALARRLSPPYDVIDEFERLALLGRDERNIVELILPAPAADGRPDYAGAAARLTRDVDEGVLAVDPEPALYVYEMASAGGSATRGLLGAVRLHEASDGVIFPHENTMAGPVADRLALMEATQANLEPIYLIYDGGGPATEAVAQAARTEPIADAVLPDGSRHRLWRIVDPVVLAAVDADLAQRSAVIADGHHRYATYLELQRRAGAERGRGPWDRGLALLVDSTAFGPQVEAIHRVVPQLTLDHAVARAAAEFAVTPIAIDAHGSDDALAAVLLKVLGERTEPFAGIVADGSSAALLSSGEPPISPADTDAAALLAGLDVTTVHTDLVGRLWGRPDTVDSLQYAHSVQEAIAQARAGAGVAILLRPTPVGAVLAIARAGLRMPRKSTLFLPKPASGMALRRFADQLPED